MACPGRPYLDPFEAVFHHHPHRGTRLSGTAKRRLRRTQATLEPDDTRRVSTTPGAFRVLPKNAGCQTAAFTSAANALHLLAPEKSTAEPRMPRMISFLLACIWIA